MFLLLLLLLFERNFWIQTCNFNLFFLCTWQNKTYLLTYLHSGNCIDSLEKADIT